MSKSLPIFLFLLSLSLFSYNTISLPIISATSSKNIDYGTYLFPSGNKYEGFFKDNKFHGQGTFPG